MTYSHRILVLLPTKQTNDPWEEEYFVPFLIDTGSPGTFLTNATIDALELQTPEL